MMPTPQPSDLPPDVGLCQSCGARNSKRATRCHACNQMLSWAPVPKEPKPIKVPSAPKISAPTIDPEAASVWGIGMVVFIASFCIPLLGFGLYKYFSNEESPLANFAAAGGLLGLALIGLGWMGRAASVGESSGDATSP